MEEIFLDQTQTQQHAQAYVLYTQMIALSGKHASVPGWKTLSKNECKRAIVQKLE